ncbi:MAG: hypothetical protein AAF226_05490 [Verrucomicrobiota bacterium]
MKFEVFEADYHAEFSELGDFDDHESAALNYVKKDFSEQDGWERVDTPFRFQIRDSNGTVRSFVGCHEPDIHHSCEPI